VKNKKSIMGEITLFRVQVEGTGVESVQDEYFETHDAAVLASAITGTINVPRPVSVLMLSDGTFIKKPVFIKVSPAPSEAEVAKLLERLSPEERVALRKRGARI